MKGEKGVDVRASNITPDKMTGIGNYSEDQFRVALTDGQAPDRALKPPMPKFNKLKRGEIDAVYAYLRTVPPERNNVKGM